MSDIPTRHERAMAHPDHQSGMISEDMIRARMAEEISDLRAEVERLRADVTQKILRRVFIVMEPDRGEGPMLGPVFSSLEAAQRFLKSPEGRYRCYLYSEDGEEVEDGR